MIRVSRAMRDARGRRISPGHSWFGRARRATADVIAEANASACSLSFDSRVYGDPSVRRALRSLFSGKCGYCEYDLSRSDLNVDHYRPKGSVAEAPRHRGYYWLAYCWRNLVSSCAFCNQRRFPHPAWGVSEQVRLRAGSSGKADSFPLIDERKRGYSPNDDLSCEQPKLIDPTVEDPSVHLTFDPLGRPVYKSIRGKASSRVYNLDTPELNRQRRCVITKVRQLLMARHRVRMIPDKKSRGMGLESIRSGVAALTHRSSPYAGAARAVIRCPEAFGALS